MKFLKSVSILALLTAACGTNGSFDSGSQGATKVQQAKKKQAISGDIRAQNSGQEQDSSVEWGDENMDASGEKISKNLPPKTEEDTVKSAQLAFSEQLRPTVKSSLTSQLDQNPKALSAAAADDLTKSLTALAQGAALGQGAQANAANVKAILGLVAKLANLNAVGVAPNAVNAAALADVAAAAQNLAAAAAALDLAGVQAAIADIIQAIMDLIG